MRAWTRPPKRSRGRPTMRARTCSSTQPPMPPAACFSTRAGPRTPRHTPTSRPSRPSTPAWTRPSTRARRRPSSTRIRPRSPTRAPTNHSQSATSQRVRKAAAMQTGFVRAAHQLVPAGATVWLARRVPLARSAAPGAACLSARFCGCTPQSCPSGCCAGGLFGGTCQQGTFDHYCGSGGAGCADCTQNATSCVNCLGGPFGGQGAQAAQNAAAAGAGFCSNQQCVFPAPSVCLYGCVDALGNCQPGSSNTACGNGGQNCVDCTVSGIACLRQQCFEAGDAGGCNAETCPAGCCDYTNQCRQGITGTACGRSGVNCLDCVLEGQICSNQTCTAPDGGSGCGAFNCNGCCDALGDCIPVNSDTQCGFAGSRCVDCSKLGDRCVAGACMNADGAT